MKFQELPLPLCSLMDCVEKKKERLLSLAVFLIVLLDCLSRLPEAAHLQAAGRVLQRFRRAGFLRQYVVSRHTHSSSGLRKMWQHSLALSGTEVTGRSDPVFFVFLFSSASRYAQINLFLLMCLAGIYFTLAHPGGRKADKTTSWYL